MVLPSENEPADEYAATRQTVRNAIDTLANEGLLRVAGKGALSREATSNGIRKYRGIMNDPTGTKRFGTLSDSSAIWI